MAKKQVTHEYELLKTEILQKMQIQNVLVTSMAIAVTVILFLIFTAGNISYNWWMMILPQMIIIPICMRYGSNRCSIAKIAAYMIIFLEKKKGFSFETKNEKLEKYEKIKKSLWNVDIKSVFKNSEFFLVSSICTLLTIGFGLSHFAGDGLTDILRHLATLVICVIVFCFIYMLIKYKNNSLVLKSVMKYMILSFMLIILFIILVLIQHYKFTTFFAITLEELLYVILSSVSILCTFMVFRITKHTADLTILRAKYEGEWIVVKNNL